MSMANARPLIFLFGISLDFRSKYKNCLTIKPHSEKRQREIKEVKAMFKPPIPQNILCLV